MVVAGWRGASQETQGIPRENEMMALLWFWIIAAPAAILVADSPGARQDLLTRTRWRTSEMRERATRALIIMQGADAHRRRIGATVAGSPSASLRQAGDRRGRADENAEPTQRGVERQNELGAKRKQRRPA